MILATLLLLIVCAGGHIIRQTVANAAGECTVTASSLSAIASDAASAAAGTTICVASGTYDGQLVLSAHPSSDITIEPVPGDTVTFTNSDHNVGIAVDFAVNARHIVLHNFYLTSEINIEAGASDITIDHNDITGGYFGIAGGSVNCSAPNAPVYPGCVSTPAITNITISGNRLHGFGYASTNNSGVDWPVDHQTPAPANSEDALHFNNFDGLHITANEITNAQEGGNHTDCLQTVWGGHNLVFDHNYEHDNQCQGFFLKDGDVSDVSVTNNLFVRDYAETYDQADLQVINASPITIRNNTFWETQGNLVRAVDSSFSPPIAVVDHNIFMLFNSLDDSGPAYQLSEDYDMFKNDPYTFFIGPNSSLVSSPVFADTATDNYQLASNPNSIGVDWHPSQYTYGPLPTSAQSNSGSGSGDSGSSSSGSGATAAVASATPNKLKAAAVVHSTATAATASATTPATNLTISNVQVEKLGQHSATVTWHTNEPASSVVRYGLGSNLNLSASNTGINTGHSVRLDEGFLKPGLGYSVKANSTDAQGHQAESQTISFHTPGITLTVKLVDAQGRVLHGGLTTVSGYTKLTDEKGRAAFMDLPYGAQTITVDYKGRTMTQDVTIGSDFSGGQYQPQTVTVRLASVHSTSLPHKLMAFGAAAFVLIGGLGYLAYMVLPQFRT